MNCAVHNHNVFELWATECINMCSLNTGANLKHTRQSPVSRRPDMPYLTCYLVVVVML